MHGCHGVIHHNEGPKPKNLYIKLPRSYDVFYATRKTNACRSFIDVADDEITNIRLSTCLKSGGNNMPGAQGRPSDAALSSSDDESLGSPCPEVPWEYGQVTEGPSVEWIKECVKDPLQWAQFKNMKAVRDHHR